MVLPFIDSVCFDPLKLFFWLLHLSRVWPSIAFCALDMTSLIVERWIALCYKQFPEQGNRTFFWGKDGFLLGENEARGSCDAVRLCCQAVVERVAVSSGLYAQGALPGQSVLR